jgi:hypothetical protein
MTVSGTESDCSVPANLDRSIACSSGIFGFQAQTRSADHVAFLGAPRDDRESAVDHDHQGRAHLATVMGNEALS